MAFAPPDPPVSLAQRQYAFAAYIRNPERHPPPADVSHERMAMYRTLFYNNIDTFLASGFPVLKTTLGEKQWTQLVHSFFAGHKSRTPYFSELGEEFLSFLENERDPGPTDPPFLLELAHYEWVELALSMAEGDAPIHTHVGDPLAQNVSLSPLAWPLAYRFPVHRIAPDFQPTEAPEQPTCLVVFRDRSDTVRFMELNAVTYRLLQLIEAQPGARAEALLRQMCEELNHPNPQVVTEGGKQTLVELAERGVIGFEGANAETQDAQSASASSPAR